MQVFSRPTYDRIAKHILSGDESVRLDILRTFTGIKDLVRAVQLDEHYNPFDPLHYLRKIINARSTGDFFEKIHAASALQASADGKPLDCETLRNLSGLYGDLVNAFPDHRYRSTVDFLCETTFGYVTIEFQVARQDHWDKRALAYAASIYGNQLRPKQGYAAIQDVIAVNLLGDGSTPYWKDGSFFRDYVLTDQENPKNKLPSLRLRQYSLGDADMNDPRLREDPKLSQWIEFFRSAHEKRAVPPSADEPLKKAYDMIRVDILKKEHPELLKISEDFFQNLTEHDKAVAEKVTEQVTQKVTRQVTEQVTQQVTEQVTQKVTEQVTQQVRNEAMIAFARKMLRIGKLSDGDIMAASGITEDDLRRLKTEEGL